MQVVQEIKIMRSNVSQREREKAERATLVTQERLVKSKVRATGGMRHCLILMAGCECV